MMNLGQLGFLLRRIFDNENKGFLLLMFIILHPACQKNIIAIHHTNQYYRPGLNVT